MIKFKKVKTTLEVPVSFVCDRCDKEREFCPANEIIHISHTFGYFSSHFDDGSELSLEICEGCAWEMFNEINKRRIERLEDED